MLPVRRSLATQHSLGNNYHPNKRKSNSANLEPIEKPIDNKSTVMRNRGSPPNPVTQNLSKNDSIKPVFNLFTPLALPFQTPCILELVGNMAFQLRFVAHPIAMWDN
jgi:hypothetical protein